MRNYTEDFQKAVINEIKKNHALGLPVFQRKGNYIIAIYPDGREVKLQKVMTSKPILTHE